MATLGISADTANALVDKLEAGILPDSMVKDAVPVTVQRYRQNGADYTRQVYADGSVALTSVQSPASTRVAGGMTTMGSSVSGCVFSRSGTVDWYRNCKVSYSGILSFDTHYVDYSVLRSSGVATIQKQYSNWSITVIGGSYRSVSLTKPRASSTATLPAVSRLSYRATYTYNGNTIVDTLCWTELRVQGWTATTAFG